MFAEIYDILTIAFDFDNIFAFFGILFILDNLSAARNLQRLLFCHALPVCCDIPKVRRCEASIGFLVTLDPTRIISVIDYCLDAYFLVYARLLLFDLFLKLF
jgi:hypothetical protein